MKRSTTALTAALCLALAAPAAQADRKRSVVVVGAPVVVARPAYRHRGKRVRVMDWD